MNECEKFIVLDVCCTIKRPTTMCLAHKKREGGAISPCQSGVLVCVTGISPSQSGVIVRVSQGY